MKLTQRLLYIFCLIAGTQFAYNITAQEIPQLDRYVDSNYVDYVKSITVISRGEGSQYMNRRIFRMDEKVLVGFDVLGDNDYYYYYTIVHCDKNWEPTDVPRSELVGGYDYIRLDQRSYSASTYTDYIRYNFKVFRPELSSSSRLFLLEIDFWFYGFYNRRSLLLN